MMRVQVLIKGRIPCIVSIREIPWSSLDSPITPLRYFWSHDHEPPILSYNFSNAED